MEMCEKCKKNQRNENIIKDTTARLNKIAGQIEGIKKMIEDNRYCGDILTQIGAITKALEAVGYIILHDHLGSCVLDELNNGNKEILNETIEIIKNIK